MSVLPRSLPGLACLVSLISLAGGCDDGASVPAAPPSPAVSSADPESLLRSGRPVEAEARIRLLLRGASPRDSAKLHYQLARALRDQGKSHEALRHARRALREGRGNPEAARLVALLSHETGDFAGAVESFREALRLAGEFSRKSGRNVPGLHFWRYQLARSLLRLDRREEARAELALYRRGQEIVQEIDRLEQLTRNRPADVEAWAGLAGALLEAREFERAVTASRRAHGLDPADPRALAVGILATLERDPGALSGSRAELEGLLERLRSPGRAGTSPLVALAAARLSLRLGERDRARSFLDRALEVNPDHPDLLHWRRQVEEGER